MMRVLLFGTSYCGGGAQNYGPWVVKLWAKLVTQLNPDCDILLVDTKSEHDPDGFLRDGPIEPITGKPKPIFHSFRHAIFQFGDNIGHLNSGGRDGWGRAFFKGIEHAIDGGYDYVAHVDSDIILTKPVMPIIEKMARTGVKVAMPEDHSYWFPDTALFFASVPYLKDIGLAEKYDWSSRQTPRSPREAPEVIIADIVKDDLFLLPLRGLRNDLNHLRRGSIETVFPLGLDYLTHCADKDLYLDLLRINGVVLR